MLALIAQEPRKVSFEGSSLHGRLHIRQAAYSVIGLSLAALVALNVLCFVQYSGWQAGSLGVFIGVQVSFLVMNAPEFFSYAALVVAYVGIASQNAVAIAATANAGALLLYGGTAVQMFRGVKSDAAKQRLD